MLNIPRNNKDKQEDLAQSKDFFKFQMHDLGEVHFPNMRNAQPQNKDPWNVRANGRQLENNNTADANLVNSASKSNDKAKIIIVAYMRSGSSLLGHMFSDNPEAFYWFESMAALYGSMTGMPPLNVALTITHENIFQTR